MKFVDTHTRSELGCWSVKKKVGALEKVAVGLMTKLMIVRWHVIEGTGRTAIHNQSDIVRKRQCSVPRAVLMHKNPQETHGKTNDFVLFCMWLILLYHALEHQHSTPSADLECSSDVLHCHNTCLASRHILLTEEHHGRHLPLRGRRQHQHHQHLQHRP